MPRSLALTLTAVTLATFATGCDVVFGLEEDRDAERDAAPSDVGGLDATPDGRRSTYPALVIEDAPLAYYRLDEESGSVAVSTIPAAPAGTYTGAVMLGAEGALGDGSTAAQLGGTTGAAAAVNLGDAFDFTGRSAFSIEAWIAPREASMYLTIASKWSRTPNDGYVLYYLGGSVFFGRCADPLTGDTADQDLISAPVALDTYTHVVATYDTAMRLYVNGAVAPTAITSLRALANTPTNFMIGAADGRYDANPFFGRIDEVAIYDKALSASRIAAHHDAGVSPL